jgi:hypothetical protein
MTCPICSPPAPPGVRFGDIYSQSVQFVDSTTLIVITPAHLPGTVDVGLMQFDGDATLPATFTFQGDFADSFESVLFPIYSPAIRGAFGSTFTTTARVSNKSATDPLQILGVDTSCFLTTPTIDPLLEIPAGSTSAPLLPTDCSTWPARFLYVARATAGNAAFNLRVSDISRDAQSFGTEIPVVRSAQMHNQRIVLLGVPIDARFRNTLRIYGAWNDDSIVKVTINGQEHAVRLTPGHDFFEPSYATFTDFPAPGEVSIGQPLRVTIDAPPLPLGVFPPVNGPTLWAFISVTNNDTQQITTITPN